MGRTFGFIIVSIGLWLVLSLPTREDVTEQPQTVSSSQPLAAAQPRRPVGAQASGATATSSNTPLESTRPAAVQPVMRANKAHDDRMLAARSREIDAEPDAAMQRPPEPVAVTSATRPASLQVPPMNGVTTHAHVAASSGARQASPNVQAIPAPVMVPVAPMLPTATTPLRLTQTVATANPATPSGALAAPAPKTAAPILANQANRPSELAGAAITAPRIFDTVRRDLSAPPAVAKGERVGADKVASATNKDSRSGEVSPLTKVIVPTSKTANEPKSVDIAAAVTDKPARKSIGVRTAASSDEASITSEPPKKPRQVVDSVRSESRPKLPTVAAPTAPRVRYVQVYAPPSYVGRVTYRYTPPAIFVPSSGTARRSQFRGDNMWESIRRGGM